MKTKLVFLAACDSQKIGEIFLDCGIEHVICIKQGRSVLDEAAIKFTKSFYNAVFDGYTFCEAFNSALNATPFNMGPGQ